MSLPRAKTATAVHPHQTPHPTSAGLRFVTLTPALTEQITAQVWATLQREMRHGRERDQRVINSKK